MLNKIGIEETFAIPETLGCSEKYFPKDVWPKFSAAILDLMDARLQLMDENGMEMMILSLNSPAIQTIYNKKEAIEVARIANDTMAEAIHKHPKRFQGFAAATEGLYGLPAEQFIANIFHPIDLVFPEDNAKVQAFYTGLIDTEDAPTGSSILRT